MTVNDVIKKLNAKKLSVFDGSREVKSGYCGDFLSFVMGKAPADCCWFTVMTNVNVAAVATLADAAVVVVCEGCECDSALILKAQMQGINVIQTKLDIFNAVLAVFK